MGKKSKKIDYFDDTEDAAADTKENVDATEAAAPKKGGKKGKKKGKAGKDDWPDSDEGGTPSAPAADSDDTPTAKPQKAASKGKQRTGDDSDEGSGRKGSAFALLAGDDDDDAVASDDDKADGSNGLPVRIVVALQSCNQPRLPHAGFCGYCHGHQRQQAPQGRPSDGVHCQHWGRQPSSGHQCPGCARWHARSLCGMSDIRTEHVLSGGVV